MILTAEMPAPKMSMIQAIRILESRRDFVMRRILEKTHAIKLGQANPGLPGMLTRLQRELSATVIAIEHLQAAVEDHIKHNPRATPKS